MYTDYIKEREGLEVLETESGFIAYKIGGKECYIKDIYVLPEKRQSRVASDMADLVTSRAKEQGCEFLTGSVCPSANQAHRSLLVLLGYGMKLLKAEKDMIYFVKRIP